MKQEIYNVGETKKKELNGVPVVPILYSPS